MLCMQMNGKIWYHIIWGVNRIVKRYHYGNRKNMLLRNHDYSQTRLYFITICTQNRRNLFGAVDDNLVVLNTAGMLVENELLRLPVKFPQIEVDCYVIMPDHIHAISEITKQSNIKDPQERVSMSRVIQAYKSNTTRRYILGVERGMFGPLRSRIWQRNFYDHIIRNSHEYLVIKECILNHPQKSFQVP